MAPKPKTLNSIEAASAPIVTVTAWQMLFEYADVTAGQTVLVHGAAGNVGAYAAQLAKQAGLHVVATAATANLDYVRALGADIVVDYKKERFEDSMTGADVVLDTVGADTQQRSLRVLKPGGILVSVVSPVPEPTQTRYGIRSAHFYVDVTTARLNKITKLFDNGKLATDVGTVLPLEEARSKALEHDLNIQPKSIFAILAIIAVLQPARANAQAASASAGLHHADGVQPTCEGTNKASQEANAKPVMSKLLPDFPGKKVVIMTVTYPPGHSGGVHRHNADGFIYVLEGSVVMGVNGGGPVMVGPCQHSWASVFGLYGLLDLANDLPEQAAVAGKETTGRHGLDARPRVFEGHRTVFA